MAFNTGNPIGSTDPRDLSDNSEDLDQALNSMASNWTDRLGNTRKTFRAAENAATQVENTAASKIESIELIGDSTTAEISSLGASTTAEIETTGSNALTSVSSARTLAVAHINSVKNEADLKLDLAEDSWENRFTASQGTREAEFEASQDDKEIRFNNLLAASGYQYVGDYAAGIEITEYNQVIRDTEGELWRAASTTTLPITTDGTGLPENGSFEPVGDAVLRQEMALGTAPAGSDTGIQTIGQALNNRMIAARAAFFGANSSATATQNITALQNAIDYAMSKRITEIQIENDLNTNTANILTNRSNAIFTGGGSLSGANEDTSVYRRAVIPANAPSARAFPDFFPEFRGVGDSVKIVVAGDSLTSYYANALAACDSISEYISAKIKNDNPDVEFTFIGLGIGGTRYTELDTIPNTSYPIADRYPWYTDDQRPWLDYVADENPDYVILSFGMNDQGSFDRSSLESVVSKILAMGAQPIFVTNMAPNLSPHPDYPSYGSYAGQEGRDYVAGWVRTYALYHGYNLIDINRTFNIARDGRDVLDTHLVEQDQVIFENPSEYRASLSQACRDFSLNAVVESAAWTGQFPLSMTVGPPTNNVVFISDEGGFLRFAFYKGGVSSQYLVVVSDIPTPIADAEIEISVKCNVFSFRVVPPGEGSDAGVQPFTQKIIRYGGLFRPYLTYFSGGGSGPVISATLSMGIERKYRPTITDLELWGIPSASAGTRGITGGNGINHPTSMGSSAIYGLHFSEQNYVFERGVEYVDGGNGSKRYKHPDGRLRCELIREVVGGATTAKGAVFLSNPISWVFPHAFVGKPLVYGSADNFDFEVKLNNGGSTPELSVGYQLQSIVSSTSTVFVRLVAEGRWKE